MDALTIIVILFLVLVPIFIAIAHKKAQEPRTTSMPDPGQLYTPEMIPAVSPAQKSAVVIFEDSFRSVRVCSRCDGENDHRSSYCCICGGKMY